MATDHGLYLLERAVADEDGHVRSSAIRLVENLGYSQREWFVAAFASDPADFARGAALDWLLSDPQMPRDQREFRHLLVKEIGRVDPRYTAARAASEALERWPDDPEIPDLVAKMLMRLSDDVGGWNAKLRSMLRRLNNRGDMHD